MTEQDGAGPGGTDSEYWKTYGYEGHMAFVRADAGHTVDTGRVPLSILQQYTREELLQELDAAYFTFESMLGRETRYREAWKDPTLDVTKPNPARDDFEQFEEQLSNKVRELRIERGWSQEELSERLEKIGFKMHQTTIAKLENGKRPIRASEVFALAYIFRLPMEALWSLPVPSEPVQLTKMREEFDRINKDLQEAEDELHMISFTIRDLRDERRELAETMNRAARVSHEERPEANIEAHLNKLSLPAPEEVAPSENHKNESGHLVMYRAQRDRVKRSLVNLEIISAEARDETWEARRSEAIDNLEYAISDARKELENVHHSNRYMKNNPVELMLTKNHDDEDSSAK